MLKITPRYVVKHHRTKFLNFPRLKDSYIEVSVSIVTSAASSKQYMPRTIYTLDSKKMLPMKT